MQLTLASLLIVSVLAVGTSFAYAEIDSTELDQTRYNAGDTISISGNIASVIETVDLEGVPEDEKPQEATPVTIKILDSQGSLMKIDQFYPTESGEFTYDIVTEPAWKYQGYYVIVISSSVETIESGFWFEQDPRPDLLEEEEDTTTQTEQTQADQDIERLQLEIQKRDNRIAELENLVFDLEQKIINLNMIIYEQIQVIMDTLLSLKN